MATNAQIFELAQDIADVCERMRVLNNTETETLRVNTTRAIDWATVHEQIEGMDSAESNFSEAVDWPTNKNGDYSPNDVSNNVFSIDQFVKLFGNVAVASPGDYGGNITKMTTSERKSLLLRPADKTAF